ncbi:hypothetical protein SLE2022_186090 [Rubroshorea leprosula]
MLRIVAEDVSSSVSVKRSGRSLSLPFSPMVMMNGCSCKSLTYSKLPDEPLKLSVLKLDGSFFDIKVGKAGTIADLKLAVQAAFSHVPNNGPEKISWPHVWGHFCLCYDDQKLLADTNYIKAYGIKDGDQLRFIRHVSISYNVTKMQTKNGAVSSKERSLSRPNSKQCKQNDEELDDCHDMENGRYKHHKDKRQQIVVDQNCRPGHFLRGWTSYSKLTTNQRTRPRRDIICPSISRSSFLDNLKKLLHHSLKQMRKIEN